MTNQQGSRTARQDDTTGRQNNDVTNEQGNRTSRQKDTTGRQMT